MYAKYGILTNSIINNNRTLMGCSRPNFIPKLENEKGPVKSSSSLAHSLASSELLATRYLGTGTPASVRRPMDRCSCKDSFRLCCVCCVPFEKGVRALRPGTRPILSKNLVPLRTKDAMMTGFGIL